MGQRSLHCILGQPQDIGELFAEFPFTSNWDVGLLLRE